MTLQEAKDKVVKPFNFDAFNLDTLSKKEQINLFDEIAELYAQQFKDEIDAKQKRIEELEVLNKEIVEHFIFIGPEMMSGISAALSVKQIIDRVDNLKNR